MTRLRSENSRFTLPVRRTRSIDDRARRAETRRSTCPANDTRPPCTERMSRTDSAPRDRPPPACCTLAATNSHPTGTHTFPRRPRDSDCSVCSRRAEDILPRSPVGRRRAVTRTDGAETLTKTADGRTVAGMPKIYPRSTDDSFGPRRAHVYYTSRDR